LTRQYEIEFIFTGNTDNKDHPRNDKQPAIKNINQKNELFILFLQ